jgi:hypothetical protein
MKAVMKKKKRDGWMDVGWRRDYWRRSSEFGYWILLCREFCGGW